MEESDLTTLGPFFGGGAQLKEFGKEVAAKRRDELTNPYDEPTLQQLQELDDLASGRTKSFAEQEARDLAGMAGAGVMGISKLRRGVSGAGTFAQAAQQAHDVRKAGMQQADIIGQKKRLESAARATGLRASKGAEERSLTMTYEGQLQAGRQADSAAKAQLFGSFISAAATIAGGGLAGGLFVGAVSAAKEAAK
tara:strand:+ start:4681 stop:5265 length:585 start_codon:yes stop_codon:yes gene_type:complete